MGPSRGARHYAERLGGNAMAVVDVPIGEHGERIRVETRGEDVRVSRAGVWEQRISREEAWRLAEALDTVATAASDGRG